MYQTEKASMGRTCPKDGTQIPKKVLKARFGGVRSVGKPRKRWEDVVQQDTVLSQLEAGR
jgi:hypothetical protein